MNIRLSEIVTQRLNEVAKLFADKPGGNPPRRDGYWTLVTVLLLAIVNVLLIVSMDNTNLATTNGLWKTPDVYAWEHGTGTPYDSGGILYARTYGFLARLIPDSAMQFGEPSPVVTFRKMAVLNGFFGGLAAAFVLTLGLRLSGSVLIGAIAALVHSCAAFVLLNSINSEDIMPAYALFVGAVACLFQFLCSARLRYLAVGTILFGFSILLHWTLMVPGLTAFGVVCLLLMRKRWTYAIGGVVWVIVFVLSTKLLVAVLMPAHTISTISILYPAKARTGFAGFQTQKLMYLAVGIGNYFCGGQNVADYSLATKTPGLMEMMALSWVYLIVGVGACLGAVWSRTSSFGVRAFAAFALALFAVGEAGNLYSQPQDPQMQLQPMLAASAGLILLMRRVQAFGISRSRLILGACAGVALVNGAWNEHMFRATAGYDARSIRNVAELKQLFPLNRTVYVSQGYEGWLSWEFVLFFNGDWTAFRSVQLDLVRPFISERGVNAEKAAVQMRKQIDEALASGKQVVACALWTESPRQFAASLSTLADEARVLEYDSRLRASYRIGRTWQTHVGRFVELLPAAS